MKFYEDYAPVENIFDGIGERSKGGKVRKEDINTFIKNKGSEHLTDDVNDILTAIHDFVGFAQFKPSEILEDVDVYLDDESEKVVWVSYEELKATLESYEKEKQELEKLIEELGKENSLLDDLNKQLNNIKDKIEKLEPIIAGLRPGESYPFTIGLLGYYKRRSNPEIHLMMKTIKENCSSEEAIKKTGIVFVHEMMHAYYDYHKPEIKRLNCDSIEEPLAEYGMLCFIEMFERFHKKYDGIFNYAKQHVESKKNNLSTCQYGYGAYLYDDRFHFGADWLTLFHEYAPTVNRNSAEVKKYESMISSIKYPRNERACECALYRILHPKRFYFEGEAHYYPDTKGNPIYVEMDKNICADSSFQIDYPNRPRKILIRFEDKNGSHLFTEMASVLKGRYAGASHRINILQPLWDAYVDKYGANSKRFAFYEETPADGVNLAEWVAREL